MPPSHSPCNPSTPKSSDGRKNYRNHKTTPDRFYSNLKSQCLPLISSTKSTPMKSSMVQSAPILQYSSPSIQECTPASSVLNLQYCLYNTISPVLTLLFLLSSTGSRVLALKYWFLVLSL